MKHFYYTARAPDGNLVKGMTVASNRYLAARELHVNGLTVISLRQQSKSFTLSHDYRRQAVLFCRQMAILLPEMTIYQALLTLADKQGDQVYGLLLQRLRQQVGNGMPLNQAMAGEKNWFSRWSCQLVAAGEASGQMAAVFTRLADYLEEDLKNQEKLISLMCYPALLLAVVTVVIVVVVKFIIPAFGGMFADMGVELPWPTRLLLQLAESFDSLCAALGLVLLALLGLRLSLKLTPVLQQKVSCLWLKVPLLGKAYALREWEKALSGLGLLLDSGMRIDRAASVTATAASNTYLAMVWSRIAWDTERGSSLSSLLQACSSFPQEFCGFVAVGEETGSLPAMLGKAAEFCRLELDNLQERLKDLIQPLVILLMGGIVLLVVLAVAMPMLDMVTMISF